MVDLKFLLHSEEIMKFGKFRQMFHFKSCIKQFLMYVVGEVFFYRNELTVQQLSALKIGMISFL